MTTPDRFPWHDDHPSFVPAQLADKGMTYAQYEELVKHNPEQLAAHLADAAPDRTLSDAEIAQFMDTSFGPGARLADNTPDDEPDPDDEEPDGEALEGEDDGGSLTADSASSAANIGAMIALIPDDATIQRLTIPGGEPADEMHLTLLYLGDAARIVPDIQQSLIFATQELAERIPVLEAEAFGVAVWNPNTEEQETSLVYSIGGHDVQFMHAQITGAFFALGDMPGIPEQHSPWVAHVCAAYSNDTSLLNTMMQKLGPVRFDRIRIAFGDQNHDFPLYDGSDMPGGDDDAADY